MPTLAPVFRENIPELFICVYILSSEEDQICPIAGKADCQFNAM